MKVLGLCDMIIKDGVSKNSEGKYDFDYSNDLEYDLIHLCDDDFGIKTAKGLTYFYAYRFNQSANIDDVKEFRRLFKNNYNNDSFFYKDSVLDFIELGMLRLDRYKSLTDFDVVFMSDFGHGDSAGVMALLDSLLLEYTNGDFLDVRLVKESYDNIQFDIEKAITALMETERYSDKKKAVIAAKSIEKRFYKLKESGVVFKIKQYMPVAGREGFYDFLKFDTDEHKRVFMSLAKGTNALICDDFITSGSTVKEMRRYLHSINPNVTLTVFILVDQLREY